MNKMEDRFGLKKWELIPWAALITLSLILIAVSVALLVRTPRAQTEAETAGESPEPRIIVRYATEEEQEEHDLDTLLALARMVWGEARGCTTSEQAAVVWCVLNRVDRPEWPDDPLEVVKQKNQFSGYDPENPVWPEHLALVEDVLDRWELERTSMGDVGRVLPKEYVFFEGKNGHNHFRTEYRGGTIWDWSLDSPYKEEA